MRDFLWREYATSSESVILLLVEFDINAGVLLIGLAQGIPECLIGQTTAIPLVLVVSAIESPVGRRDADVTAKTDRIVTQHDYFLDIIGLLVTQVEFLS